MSSSLLMYCLVGTSAALRLPTSRREALIKAGGLAASASLLKPTPSAASGSAVVIPGPKEIMTEVLVPAGKDGSTVSVSRRRYTGAGDPEWTFPTKDVSQYVLAEPFPASYPFTGPDDFKRLDEAPDTAFYKFPKLVYHIDEGAVAALTHHYAANIKPGSDILDICSSWVSRAQQASTN